MELRRPMTGKDKWGGAKIGFVRRAQCGRACARWQADCQRRVQSWQVLLFCHSGATLR